MDATYDRRLDTSLVSSRLRNSDLDRTLLACSDSEMSLHSGSQSPVGDVGADVILDVECGLNKAVLYLNRLSSGSKGACVLFDNAWLTPNEFQYVSGRETAKDWKRSIKHYGKSLKLLIAKGFMSTDPASCRCEGCVVTDDKTEHVDANMAPEANQENVPPGEQIRNDSGLRSPEVHVAEKTDASATGNTGSEEKISTEICEQRPVLQSLVDDVIADGKLEAAKTAKKRKSPSKSDETAKKLRRRSDDVSDDTSEPEVVTDDSNGDGSGMADCPDGHVTRQEIDDNWVSEPNAEVRWVQSPGVATCKASPAGRQGASEVAEVDGERRPSHVIDGETKSSDDVKGHEHLAGAGDVIEAEAIRPGSAAVSTTSPEAANHVYRPAAAEVTSAEAEDQTSALTLDEDSVASRDQPEGSPRHSATSDDDDVDDDVDDDDDDDVEDLCDSEPETEARPSSDQDTDSAALVVNIGDDVSEAGDSVPLSPRKEARLTCIIAELKSYKKQLIQRIEEQKVTGDLTDGEEVKGQMAGADVAEVTSGDSDPSTVGDKKLVIGGDKSSDKEFESSEKCKTLYHILSSGTVPEESKSVNDNNNSNNNTVTTCNSNNNSTTTCSTTTTTSSATSCAVSSSSSPSSCSPAAHSTPETQPLKSSIQKESRPEIRKAKSKQTVTTSNGSSVQSDVRKESSPKKSSSVTSSSSGSRVVHGLDSGSVTLGSPLTPIPSSMYLAPPLFPFPYGIPPGYLYPSALYGGFPFPDPSILYKSLAASHAAAAIPIATGATCGYDFSVPIQSPFKTPPTSGKHSPPTPHSNGSSSSKKDAKSGSKLSRREKQTSKSPLPAAGAAIQLFPPDSAAGQYMAMYPQFGYPDMSYLTSSASKASGQMNGHVSKLAARSASTASSPPGGALKSRHGGGSCRDRVVTSSKSNHAEGGGDILDLSVRKRSPGGAPVLDHYSAKLPCYGSHFTPRNGLVLDLSKTSAR